MKNFKYFFISLFFLSCVSSSESVSDEIKAIDSLQKELNSKNEILSLNNIKLKFNT